MGIDLGYSSCRLVYRRLNQTRWQRLYAEADYPALMCYNLTTGRWYSGGEAERAIDEQEDLRVYANLRQALQQNKDREEGQQWSQALQRLLLRLRNDAIEANQASGMAAMALAVPLDCDTTQRQKLKHLAGAAEALTLNEPEAALLGYEIDDHFSGGEKKILVVNLGGGSCWCTLLRVSGQHGIYSADILAYESRDDLGGKSLDDALLRQARLSSARRVGDPTPYYEKFEDMLSTLPEEARTLARAELRLRLRDLKHRLSGSKGETLSVPLRRCPQWSMELTGEQVAQELESLALNVQLLIQDTLQEAGVTPNSVNFTLPVGSMARLPALRGTLSGLMPNVLQGGVFEAKKSAELCVAVGAMRYAAMQGATAQETRFRALEHEAFGVELQNQTFDIVIPPSLLPPARRTKVYAASASQAASVTFTIWHGWSMGLRGNQRIGQVTHLFSDAAPAFRDRCLLYLTMELKSPTELAVTIQEKQNTSGTIEHFHQINGQWEPK